MTAEELQERQRNLWGAAAPAWERWYTFQESHARRVNEWLCRSTSLSAGKTVLDLACGSGEPSLTAARFVRPGGTVIATDIAPEMVEAVRRRAAADGVDNIEARVMDIAHIDLPDAAVDAVTCRWGYMFCPDLRRSLDESRRVLRVGGRLGLAVWSAPTENPWLGAFVNVLNQVAPSSTPPDPDALGPFRLADRARLDDLLRGAGFADHSIDTANFSFDFDSPEQWWEFVFDIAAPIRTRVLSLDESGQERVKQLVLAHADAFEARGKIRLPAQNFCAVASR